MKIIKYIFEAIFIYFLFFIIKIFGLDLSRKVVSNFFLKVGFLFKSRRIVEKNISLALGNLPTSESKKIISSMWKNYAYIFVEYLFLKKFRLNKFSKPHIELSGKAILDNLINSKKPAVFISGHFGNFELMAMELEKNKVNLGAIYRPLNNFFLNPFMVFLRKKYICKNQIEKGKGGAREIMELMKKNFSIALMVDQRLGESDRFPFFKEPAHTTTLPAQLALKFNCDIIPVYLKRNENNSFFMEIFNPIEIKKTNNHYEDKKNITIKINKIIEEMIIKDPKQWIWTHDRWK
ncbi:MAG: lipid A biosynthesis acyltransferase [Candidatus Marinimicrobia bacterium]|nr:lipid A biosynthesis acyltransferase [Candidatus Neomarinimicrobiota bacterium]|tara:strand:+ start:10686 stop:11561 length:876 start_codon:yes stop_codon:yes gene_type:complete